jgi:hypothetical protein
LGLFFGVAGSLTLFLLMIQFESYVSSTKSEVDDETLLKAPSYDDDLKHMDFDSIIVNLNEELGSKKQEIHALIAEITELKMQIKKNPPITEKSYAGMPVACSAPQYAEKPIYKDEYLQEVVDRHEIEEEEEEIIQPPKQYKNHGSFETRALDIEKIEQSLYSRDNRVEVTRL